MWALLFLFISVVEIVLCQDGGRDVYYAVAFNEDVKMCDGANGDVLDCTGVLLGNNDEGEAKLRGEAAINVQITDGDEIWLTIYKVLDIGNEMMTTTGGDICSNMDNQDTPWYSILESVNITACPIDVGAYIVEEMYVSLDFAKDVINHEFCGAYEVEMTIKRNEEVVSCHLIGLEIVEREKEK